MEIGVSPAQADVSPNSIAAQKPNSPATAPFRFCERAATPALQQAISQRMPPLPGYQSEINLRAEAWVAQMGPWLQRGAALLIDYGFPQPEYSHPTPNEGTLKCHFRHHAPSHPLLYTRLPETHPH